VAGELAGIGYAARADADQLDHGRGWCIAGRCRCEEEAVIGHDIAILVLDMVRPVCL
jgi:hypothetical protein